MTVELLMNTRPTTLQATETVEHALNQLLKHHYRMLPVVDADGRFLGVFGIHHLLGLLLPKAATVPGGLTDLAYVRDSLKDLRRRVREIGEQSVQECLKNHAEAVSQLAPHGSGEDTPTVLRPGTPLIEVLLLLYRTRMSLPVVDPDSGRLLGVVFYWEVFHKLAGKH